MKTYVVYRKVNGITSPPLRAFESFDEATEWALNTMRAAALDSIHEQETLNRRYDAAEFSGDISCSYTLAPVEVSIRRLDVTLKGES